MSIWCFSFLISTFDLALKYVQIYKHFYLLNQRTTCRSAVAESMIKITKYNSSFLYNSFDRNVGTKRFFNPFWNFKLKLNFEC